ncbi:hypothetical protein F5884DRAFT_890497 [Xylogone sp. PMI_703]|nr:hypothetical protein F5884DRAFT_890497 [Xylogone sp. PMI_703]
MSAENQANPQLATAILQALKDFGAPAPASQPEVHHPNQQQQQTLLAETLQPPQHLSRYQPRSDISPQHSVSRFRAREIEQVSKFDQICLKLDQVCSKLDRDRVAIRTDLWKQAKECESLRGLVDQVSTKLDRVSLELGQPYLTVKESTQQLDRGNEEFSRKTSAEIQAMKDIIEKFGAWGKGILGALLADINQGSVKSNAQRGVVPDRVTSQTTNNYGQRSESSHLGHPNSFNELGPQKSNTHEEEFNDYNMDQFFTDERIQYNKKPL